MDFVGYRFHRLFYRYSVATVFIVLKRVLFCTSLLGSKDVGNNFGFSWEIRSKTPVPQVKDEMAKYDFLRAEDFFQRVIATGEKALMLMFPSFLHSFYA
ncbi:hypothetical protein CDAR_313501 [Caerostris darwini]|uniref:Uncharacterized protein n=1 Tax=Caerostris darwini TaxID=1538125 RepID=A0AAV4N2X9_9ARAC|nr:hypothetical protein CDAR_313501 [Caerostris darwini]